MQEKVSSFIRPIALFGKTRDAVLGLLVLRPDERFHLRQVARLSGAGLGPVQRELADLVAWGIVSREQVGRQVFFQARADCPIFGQLQQLLLKTSGAAGVLRAALSRFEKEIFVAVIFGSMARGQMHFKSDVDVLVLSKQLTMRDLGGAIREASARLGRDVNLNLYRPEEWRERARAGHPLVSSILENPRLLVYGDPHELSRLAEERVGEAGAHHYTIESLKLTVQASTELVDELHAFKSKRGGAVYETTGIASETEIADLRKLAMELRDRVRAWLRQTHSTFL